MLTVKSYGMDAIVETCLRSQPQLYFEAGDHEDLIEIAERDYETLLGDVDYRSFTQYPEGARDSVQLY